jgi:hypothetical protein
MPRRSRPIEAKKKKTPTTFSFDNQLLNKLKRTAKDTGFTPGFILGSAFQNALRYAYRNWLPLGPKQAKKKAKILRLPPPKSFDEIADFLNKHEYRTASGLPWTKGSVFELVKELKRPKEESARVPTDPLGPQA